MADEEVIGTDLSSNSAEVTFQKTLLVENTNTLISKPIVLKKYKESPGLVALAKRLPVVNCLDKANNYETIDGKEYLMVTALLPKDQIRCLNGPHDGPHESIVLLKWSWDIARMRNDDGTFRELTEEEKAYLGPIKDVPCN